MQSVADIRTYAKNKRRRQISIRCIVGLMFVVVTIIVEKQGTKTIQHWRIALNIEVTSVLLASNHGRDVDLDLQSSEKLYKNIEKGLCTQVGAF